MSTYLQSGLVFNIDGLAAERAPDNHYVITVEGWVFHPEKTIRARSFRIEGRAPSRIETTRRTDIESLVPENGFTRDCGFMISAPFDSLPGRILHLDLEVILEDSEVLVEKILLMRRSAGFAAGVPYGDEQCRDLLLSRLAFEYKLFMDGEEKLKFEEHDKPEISVVIVTFNKPEFTLECLKSLSMQTGKRLEIIIVDNSPPGACDVFFSRLSGVRVIRNSTNAHFIIGSNIGALNARGEEILFLNNDSFVMPGAIEQAHHSLTAEAGVGAVGARLIRPDGLLQEEGSSVAPDGSTAGINSGQDPWILEDGRPRDVDYCSGAFLLTRTELFRMAGCFDQRYFPAYYEDADYCFKLSESGLRVLCDPKAVAIHFGSASSADFATAAAMMRKNRDLFAEQHKALLNRK